MARKIKVKVGRTYNLRNGASVIIQRSYEVEWQDGATRRRKTERMYLGQILGAAGERFSWHGDGAYSPLRCVSPLDIIGAVQ